MNRPTRLSLLLLTTALLSACAPAYHRQYRTIVEPAPQPRQLATRVFYYPLHGQSVELQDRDRFECYLWSREQTGFDPSLPHLAPHQRTYVVPEPTTGHDTAAGAIAGAVVGAMIGAPHNTGEGALVGALAGGILGAASDVARQDHAASLEAGYQRQADNRYARQELRANDYRRAMKACLEGRGYSVR